MDVFFQIDKVLMKQVKNKFIELSSSEMREAYSSRSLVQTMHEISY